MVEPMSDDRLAEIRARSRRHPILAAADMPEVLAEVERLRAERSEIRAALRGVSLDAMTTAELTEFVMAAIRGEGDRS